MSSFATGVTLGKLVFDLTKFFDGKLSDSDQATFVTFLRKLVDFRVLTDPYESEYAGAVIHSVQDLRNLITESTVALKQNTKLDSAFFALGTAARLFISSVDEIENAIRSNLDGLVKNLLIGVNPDKSQKEFFETWKRLGYPEKILRGNYNLNTCNIEYEGYKQRFILALGEFRGNFGLILSTLCEATHNPLPEPLAKLTPDIEELVANQSDASSSEQSGMHA